MFEGFTVEHVDVGEVTLRVRHGGEGPPWCCCMAIRGRIRPGTA